MSSATPTPRFTVGKLAASADVSANAVRYYERAGLMEVPSKTKSGYRVYGEEAMQRLRFIKHAQQCGFTLSEIKALLQLRAKTASCCNDVRSKLIEKKLELEARIKVMKAMSEGLDALIRDCSNDARPVANCPILASLSSAQDKPTT